MSLIAKLERWALALQSAAGPTPVLIPTQVLIHQIARLRKPAKKRRA